MSQEVRHILFSDAEIAAALIGWEHRQGRRVASGTLSMVSVREVDGEIEAELQASSDDDLPVALPCLRGSALAAALIAFCHHRRVPLPRRAPKRLALLDGRLLLTVVRNAAPGDPTVREGAVRYDDPILLALMPRTAA